MNLQKGEFQWIGGCERNDLMAVQDSTGLDSSGVTLAIYSDVPNRTMRIQHFLVISALIIFAGCQHPPVRESMPTITRTGEVKDVVIQDSVSPISVMARPGDEIRWINKRPADVQVIVISPTTEQLTCQRNFREMTGADRIHYTANVERNDTAAVCFGGPAELKYVVRTEPGDLTGASRFLGTVLIAPEQQRGPSMQTPQTASLTDEGPSEVR